MIEKLEHILILLERKPTGFSIKARAELEQVIWELKEGERGL